MSKLFGNEWLRWFVIFVSISPLFLVVNAVECEYCGRDFKSLGRHVWRCKQKVILDDVNIIETNSNIDIPEQIEIPELSIANNNRLIDSTNDPLISELKKTIISRN